ncbi:hypothetical protein [Streptomyces sp. NPDC047097]|uniref:hypothetical protein n=1 Tax=Streptomyces sp. NPDC047097 TaxID=3155260 RepID=UPI0033E5326E
MRKPGLALSTFTAAVAATVLAVAPAHATSDPSYFTLSYGAATVTGTNTWTNRTVITEGVNYVPEGAGSCRRVYAEARDSQGRTLAAASSSWKCSAGKHAYKTTLDTKVAGGPAYVWFNLQQKATATTPDSERDGLVGIFCYPGGCDDGTH